MKEEFIHNDKLLTKIRAGTITAALLKISAPGGRDRVICVDGSAVGLEASTRYKVLIEAVNCGEDGAHVNLVALWPSQGRTHQLRVHCAERLGEGGGGHCYILGDTKYGPRRRCNLSTTGWRGGNVGESHIGSQWDVEEEDSVEDAEEDDSVEAPDSSRGSSSRGGGGGGAQDSIRGSSSSLRRGGFATRAPTARVRRTPLCLHALSISLRVKWECVTAGDVGQRGEKMTGGGGEWKEVKCIADVPEHMMACAERVGISRKEFNSALHPFTR